MDGRWVSAGCRGVHDDAVDLTSCHTPKFLLWDVTSKTLKTNPKILLVIKFSNFSYVVNILDSGKMWVSKIFAIQLSDLLHSCHCIMFMCGK